MITSLPLFSVCVFCGSHAGADPSYRKCAQETGTWIARHGGRVVYGGGNNGLMGEVASSAISLGGSVLGIIPEALVEREWAKLDCTELRVVANMHERKRQMAEQADVFMVLPGGIGTFEEFFEVWTWRQLGYHNKPIGILNWNGFYDPLLQLMQHCSAQEFVSASQMDLIRTDTSPANLLSTLLNEAGYTTPTHLDAS
jgi:uncharacterized protein (TIGR00730 family)